MFAANSMIAVIFVLTLFQNKAEGSSSGSQTNNEDSASIPVIASGKRMHNIMRFGKRPAGGDAYIEHEKRDGGAKPPQRSFLYFGKREDEASNALPDLVLQYIQDRARNASVKKNNNGNQHNMMRFGKRSPDDSDQYNDYDDYSPYFDDIDEDKRDGHSMMYFGKRDGHNMMYFGKRTAGHNILSFGKRPAGHNMMSFGKRAAGHSMMSFGKRPAGHNMMSFGKRPAGHAMMSFGKRLAGHNMMSFGKRAAGHAMMSFGKRPAGHNMMSFGKRPAGHAMMSFGKRDIDKRAHSMIHFGKREDDSEEEEEEEKRGGHSMFHFGKRDDDEEFDDDDFLPGETKRAAHSMIHFGKRDYDEEGPLPFFWNPAAQGLYQYGKKTGKNNHAMIHFGKRSLEDATDKKTADNETTVTRSKRDLEAVESTEQLNPLEPFVNFDEDGMTPDEDMETIMKQPTQTTVYYPDGVVNPLPYVVDPLLSISPEYIPLFKKEMSKNMFMRFG